MESSTQHGNVLAVLGAMRALGFAGLLALEKSRERDLAIAMVASRILGPQSKLVTTRWWHSTTLPQELGIEDASEEDLYQAMDLPVTHNSDVGRWEVCGEAAGLRARASEASETGALVSDANPAWASSIEPGRKFRRPRRTSQLFDDARGRRSAHGAGCAC